MIKQGLEYEEIEDIVTTKLTELDRDLIGIEFVLHIENIAEVVQPETEKLLSKL